MGSNAWEHVLEDLNTLVGEELKAVSYKWLARQYSLPCNVAKQLLFSFLEQHRESVAATYLLAGWTKHGTKQHTVQLVDAIKLASKRAALEPVTSMHVYSVQPSQPKDPSELWNSEIEQTSKLQSELLRGTQDNCMADNRWSAIQCGEAKREPAFAQKRPIPTPASAPLKAPAAPQTGPAVAAITSVMSGSSARKPAGRTASITVHGSGSSSLQANPTSAEAADPLAGGGAAKGSGKSTGSESVAAIPAAQAPPAATGKKAGGSRLANMWSKAPQPKPAPAVPVQLEDADIPLQSTQQEASTTDSDEEDFAVAQRTKQRHTQRVVEEESPAKPGWQPDSQAQTKLQGSSAESMIPLPTAHDGGKASGVRGAPRLAKPAAEKPAAKPAKKPAANKAALPRRDRKASEQEAACSQDIEVDLGDADAAMQDAAQEAAAQQPKPGVVKTAAAGAAAPGARKRRKVMRTVYNDKGEEVTEWVTEDAGHCDDDGEAAKPALGLEHDGAPAAAAPVPSGKQTDAKSQAKPAAASKTAKPGGKKSSKPNPAAGQRGIMSFFTKK